MPSPSSTVFIHDDPTLAELFDDLASALHAQGVRLSRGKLSAPELRDPEVLRQRFQDVDVAVFSSRAACPKALIDAAPRLRGIVAPTIGTETIDVATATARGILVANGATPANALSMAESTVMLILNLLYRPDLSADVIQGRRARPDGRERPRWARTLAGRTVCVAGYGRIGQAVATRLHAFGAEVRIATRDGKPPRLAQASDGLRFGTLDEILPDSEILTLHADASAGQAPIIGERELARLPAGALLVNTARGQLVDETALADALASGRLGGAALDTFVIEPLPEDSRLRHLQNVFLTPHLVGHTREMFASFLPVAVDNVVRLLRGQVPHYCRNPDAVPAWQRRLQRPAVAAA